MPEQNRRKAKKKHLRRHAGASASQSVPGLLPYVERHLIMARQLHFTLSDPELSLKCLFCAGIDLAAFPRPTGDAAEAAVAAPTPLFPANAHPRYLRLTCNAIPAQQVRHRLSYIHKQSVLALVKQSTGASVLRHT